MPEENSEKRESRGWMRTPPLVLRVWRQEVGRACQYHARKRCVHVDTCCRLLLRPRLFSLRASHVKRHITLRMTSSSFSRIKWKCNKGVRKVILAVVTVLKKIQKKGGGKGFFYFFYSRLLVLFMHPTKSDTSQLPGTHI